MRYCTNLYDYNTKQCVNKCDGYLIAYKGCVDQCPEEYIANGRNCVACPEGMVARDNVCVEKPSEDGGKLTNGEIAGIVIGVIAALAIIIGVVWFTVYKVKSKKQIAADEDETKVLVDE